MLQVNQYDVVLVNLEPTVGSEMKKTRRCVVLSPDEMNKFLRTIVVAPITSTSKPYPTRILIQHATVHGWIAIDQIRTIDRVRILRKLSHLMEREIIQVKSVIQETFVA